MRRSARETRRPEFLTYQASTSIAEDQSDSDHNSEPNEVKAKKKRERSSAKKEEISGEGEEESDFEENEPKAKRPTKKAKKAATNTKDKNAEEEEERVRDISLFDSVQTFAGKDFSSLCNGWLEKHQESPVQSWTELMNFVLMSAGLEKDSIHPDTDLDALNPEEIENMLAKTLEMMTQRGAKSYPLNEKPKNKSTAPYRTKYQSFWQCLAQKLFELKDHLPSSSAGSAKPRRSTNPVKSNLGVELMNQLVDYLASFSSLPSVNVRDAIAEAALSLAEGAIPLANQLKEATITADRQLHQSSSTSLKNPKSKAFAEQKEEYSHDLNLWSEVISSVFNTIYISRSKDFNEDVRLVCVRHLEQLIRFDVSRPVKTEYLKYLGWACYDHAHAIRFEAVRAINNLIQDDAIIGSLVNFVLHFMDRFIEIASCDIDADVSLEMISTMRVMQKQGFLDTVSEDKLDMVDVIIFDPDATSEMRREALLFLMDHTEGFDLPLEAEEEKGTQKARSKSSDKKATKNRPGEFNKNIAFQLETLTEFAEHNLTPETVDWSFLLAEACLDTDKAPILYDWNTAISLLTKDFEDEELIAKPLRDIQIAILLQLMLTAAKQVNSQRKQLEEHGLVKGNNKEKELVNHRWESLNQSLGSKLSSLLTRFKDNDKNLAALTELLSCCEISTTMKSSQTLIKSIKDIFLTFNSESLLRNILLALRRWKVDDVFDNLFNLSVASFQTNSVEFEKRETNEAEDQRKNQQKNHRRRSSSTNRGDVTERRDALLDSIHKLGGDMMRLRLLFENVDCRQFLRKDSEKNLIVQVEEVANHLIEILKKVEDFSLIQRTDLEVLNQLAHDLLFGVFALVLWKYNDVMNLGDVMELSETRRQSRIKANGSSKESQSEGDQLALEDVLDQKDISLLNSKIEDLLEVREKLVEMSLSYMRYLKFVSESVNSSDEEISVAEAFAISGFRIISYLRSYFPLRQNKYLGVDRLLFQPSSEALGLLKFVFDNISQRINEQLDQLEVDNEATADQNGQEKKLSRVLIEQLLLPLSGSFVYDTENFNRRQTAAVLLFILHRNPSVVEAVKTIAKKLRDKELVAYLEAQFVALKSCFAEEVLRPLSLKQQAENAEDDVDFDFADNEASIQSGYERLIAYSRKFSSLLGVGKLKESALEAVEAFLRLAVEFTFTDALHVGFCEALAPFLRFLPTNRKKELHQFLLNELETNEKYSDLLSEFTRQKAVPDVEFQRFFLFLDQLSTGQAAGIPSKQSKRKLSSSQIHSTTEPRDQEVPKVAAKPSMASQTPTKKGSTSKNKSSRMSKISNVTLSPIRETRRSSRNAGKKVKYNESEEDEDDGIEEFDDDDEEEQVFTSQKAKTSQKTKRDQAPATPTSLNSFATGLDIEDYEDVEESPRPRGSQRRNNSSSNKRSRDEDADTNFIPSELLMLDTSPIQLSGIEDLENVPRRRKLLS